MADEREFEQPMDGVDAGDSDESAQPTADQEQDGQPSKVNLDDIPEYRQVKSSYDRKLAEERRAREQAEQTYQQQLAQQRQFIEQQRLAEMDDYQRLEYRAQQAEQRAQYSDQMLEQMRSEQRKFQQLSQVAQETKVPLDYLMEHTERPDDIWRVVTQYTKQSEQRRAAEAAQAAAEKQRQKQDKVARNTVNTGSGTTVQPNAWDQSFKGARTSQDLAKLFYPQE